MSMEEMSDLHTIAFLLLGPDVCKKAEADLPNGGGIGFFDSESQWAFLLVCTKGAFDLNAEGVDIVMAHLEGELRLCLTDKDELDELLWRAVTINANTKGDEP